MKRLVTWLMCLLPVFTWAQEVTWTEEFRVERKQRSMGMIGAAQGKFYVLRGVVAKDHNYELEVFNEQNMELISKKPLILPTIGDNDTQFEELILVKDRLLLFSSYTDRNDGRSRCYGTWLNENGEAADLPVLVGDLSSKMRREENLFGFEVSADSSLILVHYGLDLERKGNERFTLKVLDTALEMIWQKDIELPYRSELMEITQYALDNSGQVYMMSGISGDKATANSERRLTDKRYVLLSYDPVQNKLKEFNVELSSKWVMATTFGITDEGDLAIGGFYSNDRVFSIAGTFFFRIDGDSKMIVAKGLKPFDEEFLKKFMSERKVAKGEELYDFYFDHFTIHEDGGATFVAEQYYIIQRFRTDITTGRQQMLYYYHYNDIIVVDVEPDGSIGWTKKVPKEQITMNDTGPYSSYAFTASKDSLYLLFNDHPDNTGLLKENPDTTPRTYGSSRQGVVVKVAIGLDGGMKREEIFTNKEEDTILKPKVHLSQDDGILFIYAEFRKQYRFGRMKFSNENME